MLLLELVSIFYIIADLFINILLSYKFLNSISLLEIKIEEMYL